MAKLKQRGKSGAAKAYITRSSAIKKLQCSLADFRRLCILKGIFPREPRHRKRANKGSSAPTTFYYAKDIAYLTHEPILRKLREHKAFAKKLARALGRGEWSSAKSLEENKPIYTLDHIVKERVYPTFIDALRDIDDALCLIHLFAALPTSPQIPTALISNCTRLSAEWQLYVMRTHALRKVFLSIKGIYFQAEVMGQTITWLVPYQFTQPIPADVDARVMLTFVELYQTLLGFVFFKLYSDVSLVYPPHSSGQGRSRAGVGAFTLEDIVSDQTTSPSVPTVKKVEVDGKTVTNKDVKRAIMDINATPLPPQPITSFSKADADTAPTDVDILPDDFVVQPSKSADGQGAPLLTMRDIAVLPSATSPLLFSSLNIFLSRETPRPLLEFVVRAFGGRVGWPATLGAGSPFDENDPSITHVIVDRPLNSDLASAGRRKYVQPQWVIDSINAGRLLVEDTYAQGKILPPHLSPFGEGSSTYVPDANGAEPTDEDLAAGSGESDGEEEEQEDEKMAEVETPVPEDSVTRPALAAAAAAPEDPALRRAAEIEAERAGAEYATFEADLKKAIKKTKKVAEPVIEDNEIEMNKMLMSNKQRKLYERMKHGEKKRALEASFHIESCRLLKSKLEQKRDALRKAKAKEVRKGTKA
ncbi:pescadillo domain protein [Rhizoctonia solani]|uniref:Pescadillo homolog n=1 Tax=Rhizoctonia solani TaxID=456999 RepID=A0A8H8SUF1_9AGAM|nr:pescadillo domain protein [Rhizoctonia solani]QRW18851.1 pescadillo domain protein [Rhizoctonia solani]